MKYEVGQKTASNFQKLLNQWKSTNIDFDIIKTKYDFTQDLVFYILLKK